jgi:hypothetical protein
VNPPEGNLPQVMRSICERVSMKRNHYTIALVGSVIALCTLSHDAKAVTISFQDDSDFVTLPASSVSPYTPQTTGTVYFNELGSLPNIYRSPFENANAGNGGVYNSNNGGYQQPGFDLLPYTSIEANSTATYTFSAAATSLSLLWGSPDSYNYIAFYSGPNGTGLEDIISGSALLLQTYGHDQVTLTLGGEAFDSVVLSSSGSNAFEFANLLATTQVGQLDHLQSTPLPAALPLFVGGLGIMGFLARSRKRNATADAAA